MTAEQVRNELEERILRNEDMSGVDLVPRDGVNCARPCVWVACRHHLLMDVVTNGRNVKKLRVFKAVPFDETGDGIAEALTSMKQTCSLDVAEEGGGSLEEVGGLMGVTRQRVEAIEHIAHKRAQAKRAASEARADWKLLLTRG